MPHQDLHILFEVLRERVYRYSSELPIFKALNKHAKMLFGRNCRGELLPKSFFYLKRLGFPKLTITKSFEEYVSVLSVPGKKEERHNMPLTSLIKMGIFCVEENYIHLVAVQKMLSHILKEHASTLASLSSLYHLSMILTGCLEAKVNYQLTRTSAREILFNPY